MDFYSKESWDFNSFQYFIPNFQQTSKHDSSYQQTAARTIQPSKKFYP